MNRCLVSWLGEGTVCPPGGGCLIVRGMGTLDQEELGTSSCGDARDLGMNWEGVFTCVLESEGMCEEGSR